ncbi:Lipid-binding serum glycoprotein [Macleaya cordata]|uniref:Lipid-binding serum glycoprotein n=1 Tax=Macleaya cordata TaxID=56857 RepID=A0A200QI22_MACCD|nr:Lipid-binding serum glycoprotein [Macleaya cordata]
MALTIFFILITLLFIPANTQTPSNEKAFISVFISQKGLDFAKDILIEQAISSLTPLQVPQIQKSIKIPLVGEVHVTLSNITLYHVDVSSSTVKPGDMGVTIVASGATANLSMNWNAFHLLPSIVVLKKKKGCGIYELEERDKCGLSDCQLGMIMPSPNWYPSVTNSNCTCSQLTSIWSCSHKLAREAPAGTCHSSDQVEGMEVGLTLGLENQEGTLKLSLMECGCNVNDISITLDGGASWLYQGLVDAFEGQIRSTVENSITKKMKEGIAKLDSLLQTLPKEIPVDDVASLNITFVNEPVLTASYIGFDINGLFTAADNISVPTYYSKTSKTSISCNGSLKMLGISLDEAVFNSGSSIYFEAGLMQWIVDKVPDQALLNTAGWKYIVPKLYQKYPDKDMSLNISLSSPPLIRISAMHDIDTTVFSDVTIDVLDANETIPVACISLVVHASTSVKIKGNNLAGYVKLDDFSLSLKWSEIGNFHMYLIQSVMRTFLRTIALPYINLKLREGLPLPILRGFTLQNADILCTNSRILICSDVVFTDKYDLKQLQRYRD